MLKQDAVDIKEVMKLIKEINSHVNQQPSKNLTLEILLGLMSKKEVRELIMIHPHRKILKYK